MTGATFIAWRERHDINQREAADKLGVHRNTVSNWERDESVVLPLHIALACAAISYGLEPMK